MSDWKQNLQKTRYVMDVFFLIGFMIVSAPQATGVPLHEWFSVVLIVPFVIHLLLHWDWAKASFKRLCSKVTMKERFNIVWSYLIYLMMLLVFVSGFLVSEAIFPFLDISLEIQAFWSKLHHDSATFIMPMLGVHLALHWSWMVKFTKRMMTKEKAA
ncbi:cytochrome b/b6 domain-containing protein [Shewanella electrodiphila]|uniref:Cytochrome b/b6 domain-containing protein n=1 Tax=Shewanella electrodiphila TaxID=934143 RepID=A0ABT0KRC3_9GAMM|nr:cytochrome b/b6 domain-containing protein [Shewanella electrodiphila]MCL1046405.1 cytochrome b/b6 domain-containing protein [Shewanella electrodiphila]